MYGVEAKEGILTRSSRMYRVEYNKGNNHYINMDTKGRVPERGIHYIKVDVLCVWGRVCTGECTETNMTLFYTKCDHMPYILHIGPSRFSLP